MHSGDRQMIATTVFLSICPNRKKAALFRPSQVGPKLEPVIFTRQISDIPLYITLDQSDHLKVVVIQYI